MGDFRALRDVDLRLRYEPAAGIFIAEGPHAFEALVDSRHPVRSALVEPRRLSWVVDRLRGRAVTVFVAEREVLRAVVRFRLHQGVLGCGARLDPPDAGEVVAAAAAVPPGRLAVLEEANDHENLGVLFRSARALGVGGVLLGPGSADPLYRRSVRVSMGHVLHVPHRRVDDLPAALDLARGHGFRTVALTPDPAAVDLATVPRDVPLALLLGAEGPGLRPATLATADVRARIPIAAEVDSLNVAVAASIAFHVLRRVADEAGPAGGAAPRRWPT